mmetsp:Transcript_36805/g.55576  ORF Transcript_36805/g.55576 Transcript_36805/m.55576 type:complete len:292 (+) Transcript_36805:141-1016(+)
MGCIVTKEASEEQRQEICKEAAKEMATLCLEPAASRADKIIVKLPPDFEKMKEVREKLLKLQEDATSGKPGEGDNAKSSGGGGIMGMITKGLEKVGDAIGDTVAASFGALAEMMEASIKGLEGPMAEIAKDLIAAKKTEILKVLSNAIVSSGVENAEVLCRGESKTAISEHFVQKSAISLGKQLLPDCGEFIKQHKAIQAWNAAVVAYNKAVEKLKAAGLADKFKLEGIDGDIKQYICEQTVLGLGAQMGDEETKVREDPRGKPVRYPQIFTKVFTKHKLLESDWRQVAGN